MADPFSITVGVVGLAEVCIRLGKLLKDARDDFHNADHELYKLETHLSAVKDTVEQVRKLHDSSTRSVDTANEEAASSNWRSISSNLKACHNVVNQLDKLLTTVIGQRKLHPKTYQFRKCLRLMSKEKDFALRQNELQSYNCYLQTNLVTITLFYTIDTASRVEALGNLQAAIKTLQNAEGLALGQTRDSTIASAETVLSIRSLNEHFDPPRAVSSLYTGRSEELDTLSEALSATSGGTTAEQKRFVVYGPPGSGKTEFCCKFASDNKHKFWAVFHIVASSREHVKQDFAQIALSGKVDPNERAAKNWLSCVGKNYPWLLIVDNADDDSFPLHDCYPDGENGVILITTRISSLKNQGTGAVRYFEFGALNEVSSCQLLLNAADRRGCSSSTRQVAEEICTRLGHLPLALTLAGKTISERSLRLEDYLPFLEDTWARNRRRRSEGSKNDVRIFDADTNIFATYDGVKRCLEEKAHSNQGSSDALDLLRIFAFFHHQRIRRDLLRQAAQNPILEQESRAKEAHEEELLGQQNPRPACTWSQALRKSLRNLIIDLTRQWNRPVLPKLLSPVSSISDANEVSYRTAAAIKELNKFSLLFHSAEDQSFSIHPAVHLWLREGPDMTIGEQAIWCNVAATIVAQAILAPPLHNTNEAELMRRDLVSHVASIQLHQKNINARFAKKQRERSPLQQISPPKLNSHRATQLFKFSLVYMQGGQLDEAYKLQRELLDFVQTRLGQEHPITMDLKRLIARNLWLLNKNEEAAGLRFEILEMSRRVRGEYHPGTLAMMDEYGSAMWQQGQFRVSLRYHSAAVAGFNRIRGPDHPDTLRAMSNLGSAYSRDWKFTQAVETSIAAKRGLEKQFGDTHADTLNATDALAMVYFDRVAFGRGQPGDLTEAIRLEKHVLENRKEMLGREHIFTLWANLNLARMKALHGNIDEALSDYDSGHVIAVRNLGEHSHPVLFGQLHYARILTYANRYAEAETVLVNVTEHLNTGPPDRILALFTLIKCRHALGKTIGLAALVAELRRLVTDVFGEGHPAVEHMEDPRNGIVDSPNGPASDRPGSSSVEAFAEDAQQMLARYGHVAVPANNS